MFSSAVINPTTKTSESGLGSSAIEPPKAINPPLPLESL